MTKLKRLLPVCPPKVFVSLWLQPRFRQAVLAMFD